MSATIRNMDVPVTSLRAWPLNPRKPAPGDVASLVESVRQHGVIEPLIVRENGHAEGYEIVCGERRWRAAKEAGVATVPVRCVGRMDDQQALVLSLVENIERRNLDPIEEAEALFRLTHDLGMTQESVGTMLGRSQPGIANRIRLLRLPSEVKTMIRERKLSASHGVAIVRFVASPAVMLRMAEIAVRTGSGSKEMSMMPMPFAAEIGDAGLIRYVSPNACRFDTRECRTCPFQSFIPITDSHTYGWCLRPEHWDELERAASNRDVSTPPEHPPETRVRPYKPRQSSGICRCCGQVLPQSDMHLDQRESERTGAA